MRGSCIQCNRSNKCAPSIASRTAQRRHCDSFGTSATMDRATGDFRVVLCMSCEFRSTSLLLFEGAIYRQFSLNVIDDLFCANGMLLAPSLVLLCRVRCFHRIFLTRRCVVFVYSLVFALSRRRVNIRRQHHQVLPNGCCSSIASISLSDMMTFRRQNKRVFARRCGDISSPRVRLQLWCTVLRRGSTEKGHQEGFKSIPFPCATRLLFFLCLLSFCRT